MHITNYLPIEYVFYLANLHQKGLGGDTRRLRFALRNRVLRSLVGRMENSQWTIPRVSFWVRLCQAAFLLDESPTPYPTFFMKEWLSWNFFEQIAHLFKAWLKVPANEKFQHVRKDIIYRLQCGMELNKSHCQELVGLQALGICSGEHLTKLGLALLNNKDDEQYSGFPSDLWQIEKDRIIVPFPPDWRLLWELERYLDAEASGSYVVDALALQLAAQRGAIEKKPSLPEILKLGLGTPPPESLLGLMHGEPVIRLVTGYVLEFKAPEDLKELRQMPSMRRQLDGILSPRHVALDPWHGVQVLQHLYRKGLLSECDFSTIRQPGSTAKEQSTVLPQTDRAFLLSLLLLAGGLQKDFAPPPGLVSRLVNGLDHTLCAAAANRASAVLKQIYPQPTWQMDVESPPPPSTELVTTLQKVIDQEESVNILYQASGRHTAEYRHLTPLLIEQRGERYYLMAYCHTRRANRTFRLDRLKLIE